jgi:hypothetical protein
MTPIGILKTVRQIALFDFDVKLSLGTHFFVKCKKHHFDKVCVYGEANNLLRITYFIEIKISKNSMKCLRTSLNSKHRTTNHLTTHPSRTLASIKGFIEKVK